MHGTLGCGRRLLSVADELFTSSYVDACVPRARAGCVCVQPLVCVGIGVAVVGFGVLGRASWLRDHPSSGKKQAAQRSLRLQQGSDEEKAELKGGRNGQAAAVVAEGSEGQEEEEHVDTTRLWLGVAVSLFAGLFSALLQFAFIYGGEVIGRVEKAPYLASPRVSSAVIFTVSTGVNNAVQSLYMAYLVTAQGKWNYLQVS